MGWSGTRVVPSSWRRVFQRLILGIIKALEGLASSRDELALRAAETEDAVRQIHADPALDEHRISHDTPSAAQRVLSALETEARKHLRPLLQRLDLPSRTEVERLSRRIRRLERCVGAFPVEAPAVQIASPSVASLERLAERRTVHCGACGSRLRSRDLGAHSCDESKDLDPEERIALFWDEA